MRHKKRELKGKKSSKVSNIVLNNSWVKRKSPRESRIEFEITYTDSVLRKQYVVRNSLC